MQTDDAAMICKSCNELIQYCAYTPPKFCPQCGASTNRKPKDKPKCSCGGISECPIHKGDTHYRDY